MTALLDGAAEYLIAESSDDPMNAPDLWPDTGAVRQTNANRQTAPARETRNVIRVWSSLAGDGTRPRGREDYRSSGPLLDPREVACLETAAEGCPPRASSRPAG